MPMQVLEQLLVDALNSTVEIDPDRLAAMTSDQWREWLALVAVQRVRPILWQRLKQKGVSHLVPDEMARALRESLRRNTMRNLRLYGELRSLLAALAAEDIPVILLKGIYLADAVYDSVGLREMNDIDILARPGDLRRIADILIAMGYQSPRPISPEVTLKTSHHLPPLVKQGYAVFEIHWSLMEPEGMGYVAPDVFRERAVPVRVAGCDTLALSAEDLLLHLCYHTSFHHLFAFGLRPSCDIAAVIDRFGPDIEWHKLAERARRLGWQRGVYLALRLARDLAGAHIPDDLLTALRPPGTPDAIDATARSQLFGDKEAARPITIHFAELLQKENPVDKGRIFLRRLFLPRLQMAAIYSVPADSLRIYACYPHRLFYLLFSYSHHLNRYHQDDGGLHALVERQNRICSWLAGLAGE